MGESNSTDHSHEVSSCEVKSPAGINHQNTPTSLTTIYSYDRQKIHSVPYGPTKLNPSKVAPDSF